jgi:hypothetical protein
VTRRLLARTGAQKIKARPQEKKSFLPKKFSTLDAFNSSSTFGSTSYKRSGFPAGTRHLSILAPPVAVSLRHPRL